LLAVSKVQARRAACGMPRAGPSKEKPTIYNGDFSATLYVNDE
jgi:hypothetical protein